MTSSGDDRAAGSERGREWAGGAFRTLVDIQQMGLEAAAEVVDRMAPLFESIGQVGSRAPFSGPEDSRSSRDLRADLERAVDANLDLMRRIFDTYADLIDDFIRDGSTRSAGSRSKSGSDLELPPVVAGHQATSTLWIHNTITSNVAELRLHSSDLVNHLGETISKDNATFDPVVIEESPAGASIPISMTLAVAPDVNPGTYRGRVFVTNLPEETVGIIAHVVEPAP